MRSAKRARNIVLALLGALGVSVAVAGVVLAAPSKPTFSLGISPASQSIQQGQATTYTVTVSGANGFSGSVALSVTGLPSGAAGSLSPAAVNVTATTTSATSTLTVTTAKTTPTGTSTLTISGTSASTKASVTATLTVTYALIGSYTVTASPSTASVAPGSIGAYTVSVSSSTLVGAVNLAPYGSWPAGTSTSFSVNPVQLNKNTVTSTLQVKTTSGTTPDGTYNLYVIGTYQQNSQNFYQYAQLQLVVDSKLSSKPFTISGGTPARSLAPGVANQPLNLAITNPNNQTLPVTNLSVAVTGTSNASCSASNFAVTQYSGPYPLNVPANANAVTLTALGVPSSQQPQLKMLDLNTKQDACKGVTVNLSYSGSAQGN